MREIEIKPTHRKGQGNPTPASVRREKTAGRAHIRESAKGTKSCVWKRRKRREGERG